MFNKLKIKKWFKQGQQALDVKDDQQAIYFLKLVIETSIKNGGIKLNECFSSFVLLGDIYSREKYFEEADLLYHMAAGIDFSAKFILLKKELFHDDSHYEVDRKKWLKENMIDFTDIIQAKDGKNWTFLIEEGKISYQTMLSSKKRPIPVLEEITGDSFWSYEDCLDTSNI
ncbi:hypothetical protein IGL98_002866 [Enterococcus sp. DIV0840]|uniref:hypothetical protein n=1 Tax=Enterococcus TaxID=1350 RepID=UPI001A904950|nr:MULTISPECIES: hypothetical protein [Enterococcus]MBO0433867.1 hypothetical protein [Enterococcus sp. DIV0849a]MBO0472360.1 hypothetical protein [Enterococcus ureasiticus]